MVEQGNIRQRNPKRRATWESGEPGNSEDTVAFGMDEGPIVQ
jgi:hypothetical protein